MFIAWFFLEPDIQIETTFMRYGKGPNKIINITLKHKTMKRWAYSKDTCSRIVQDIANMSDHSGERKVTSHEKEKPSRMTWGAKHRDKIRKRLTCIQARRQNLAAGRAKKQTEGPKTRRGGHIFKIQYWMYAATGGPNMKWGGTDFKWGGRSPLAPPLPTALLASLTWIHIAIPLI